MSMTNTTNFLKNKKWFLLCLSLVMMIGVLVPISVARADALGDLLKWFVDGIGFLTGIASLLYILERFLGLVLAGIAMLVDWAMQPIQLTTSVGVRYGWGISRDLANMFFILVLMAVALDYILIGSFGVKKAIPKIIVVALLINFSLPIAGVFIDFANIVSNTFQTKITGGMSTFSESIANKVRIQKINDLKDKTGSGEAKIENQSGLSDSTTINLLFSNIFLAGTIFVFLALAVVFFIRNIYLYFLLIILPLALVADLFPMAGRYFSEWKSKFFHWVFYGPIALFMLYLAILMFQGILRNSSLIDELFNYIVVWVLLMAAITAAHTTSDKTAQATLKLLDQAKNWGVGKVKGAAWGAGKKAYQYGREGAEKAGAATALDKGAEIAGKIPIIGGWGARGLTKASMRIQVAKKEVELTKDEKNVMETGSSENVTNMIMGYYNSYLPEQRKKAAKLLAMDKKGKFKIRDAEGKVTDETKKQTREIKWELRKIASGANDFDTIKAIEATDFELAERAINEKYKYDKKAGKFTVDEKTTLDENTGKPIGDERKLTLSKLYNKINLEKEDWDDSVVDDDFVKELVKYKAANSERFRQAQRSGNTVIIDTFIKLLKSKDPEFIEDIKNNPAFINFLISTAGLSIIDVSEALKDAGLITEEKYKKIKEGD